MGFRSISLSLFFYHLFGNLYTGRLLMDGESRFMSDFRPNIEVETGVSEGPKRGAVRGENEVGF